MDTTFAFTPEDTNKAFEIARDTAKRTMRACYLWYDHMTCKVNVDDTILAIPSSVNSFAKIYPSGVIDHIAAH